MRRRQRFGIGDVDHRRAEPTAVERRQQIGMIKLGAASRLHQRRAGRQLRKQIAVKQAARLRR